MEMRIAKAALQVSARLTARNSHETTGRLLICGGVMWCDAVQRSNDFQKAELEYLREQHITMQATVDHLREQLITIQTAPLAVHTGTTARLSRALNSIRTAPAQLTVCLLICRCGTDRFGFTRERPQTRGATTNASTAGGCRCGGGVHTRCRAAGAGVFIRSIRTGGARAADRCDECRARRRTRT